MRQATTLDQELEMNPLYRKMRDRFTYDNGRMTIAQIMLYRAERDGYSSESAAQPTQAAPVARPAKPVTSKKAAKKANAFKHFVKSHSVAMTCIALTLSAILVLALMIPFISGAGIFSENVSAAGSDEVHNMSSTQDDVAEVPETQAPVEVNSSFSNIMESFNSNFGN